MSLADSGFPSIGDAMQQDMSEETPEVVATEEEEVQAQQENAEQQEQPVDGSAPVSDEEIERELEEMAEEEELSEVEQLARDVAKWKETAVRTAADLENYRKRMAREKTEAIKFGNQRLLGELLPVLDNFNMGMMAAEQDQGSMIYMGMQMVQKQIEDFLSNQGVTVVECKAGDMFDPNLHEAMSQEQSDEIEEGKIIRVMRRGYRIGDRLLRAANVVVSAAPEAEAEAAAEEAAE